MTRPGGITPRGGDLDAAQSAAPGRHRALREAGSKPARDAGFHQLRHHYASTLLAGGVDVRTLADALGHRDPGFTLRVYAHLMPDSADRIRAAIDRAATGPEPAQAAEKLS